MYAQEKAKHKLPHLFLIYGDLYEVEKLNRRVSDLWTLCHAVLWPNENFTEEQEIEFKKLLAAHFDAAQDFDLQFIELAQRVLLAKRYVERKSWRYMEKPIDYLSIQFKTGLAATKTWYNDVTAQRKTVPHYNEGILYLAKGLLHFFLFADPGMVRAYRQKFIEIRQFDLLAYYNTAIVHHLLISE